MIGSCANGKHSPPHRKIIMLWSRGENLRGFALLFGAEYHGARRRMYCGTVNCCTWVNNVRAFVPRPE